MVSLEQLRVRGLRAYEAGRLRAASRITLVVAPLAAVCLLEERARGSCACCAVVLVGMAIWLRWRDRLGTEGVTTGLLAGAVPLVAGLVLKRMGVDCGAPAAAPLCMSISILVGLVGGVLIAYREAGRRTRLTSWLVPAAIAALAASLGCARLGVASVASAVLGITLGTAVASMGVRRAT
jgi:hypothetical protein